jgi:hypothetical protein
MMRDTYRTWPAAFDTARTCSPAVSVGGPQPDGSQRLCVGSRVDGPALVRRISGGLALEFIAHPVMFAHHSVNLTGVLDERPLQSLQPIIQAIAHDPLDKVADAVVDDLGIIARARRRVGREL